MKVDELLAAIRAEVLTEFSDVAGRAEHVPVAQWIGRILFQELNRRRGEPVRAVPPLELDAHAIGFAVEWLDQSGAHLADLGIDHGDADLVRLGALLDLVGRTFKERAAFPLQ